LENQLTTKKTMENLAKAIIKVMQDVKGIEKSMTIGTGASTYKGVPDQEVKKIIGESMAKNGLCILPIETKSKTQVDRWEETSNGYSKMKQNVFTEVETKYLLLHTSGESQTISGYGHGVDSQDKGAGKATTYALKYALLYTFLVPTGKIDDADATHSDQTPPPPPQATNVPVTTWLTEEQFKTAMASDKKGIVATLATFNGLNGKGMKKDFNLQLTQKLSTLKDE
jgi:hypothetical protein